MKRSQINQILRDSDEFFRSHSYFLPPFAYWSPADWQIKGVEVSEIAENHLGWDITDFGSGNFEKIGLFLFTIRNGKPENWETRKGKLYAEKVLVVRDGQITPMHFHWMKSDDIINRGGGELVLQLYNATPDETLSSSDVSVSMDGVRNTFPAGGIVRLKPGESITLPPRLYHQFWGERDTVLVGEVSMVNDDDKDNRFLDPIDRFPEIEEDEPPLHLLCTDYKRYYHPG